MPRLCWQTAKHSRFRLFWLTMKKRPHSESPPGVSERIERQFAEVLSSPPMPPKEYIYLTKSDFGYKIGRTTRPQKRPLQVAGNMPIKLEVIVVIEVANSKEWERRLHRHFAEKRLRGEWFSLDQTDVELIKGVPNNWDDFNLNSDEIPF